MAEVTSEDFQKLIKEQQTTNVLLAQGNQDPSLPSSIRQNLGEILNARSLATRSEKFATQQGTTQVDEKVDELKDVNQTFFQQISNKLTGIGRGLPSISLRM